MCRTVTASRQRRQPLRRQEPLIELVSAMPTDPRRCAAAASALQRQLGWAQQGRSPLHAVIGRVRQLQVWRHYPRHDAVSHCGRWQFYFHVHDPHEAQAARHPQERGHIHVFRRSPSGRLSHLVGLSLDDRGVPLMWFTTNQWVTGERWLPAPGLIRSLPAADLRMRGPLAGLAAWLSDVLVVYTPTLTQLLTERDRASQRYAHQHGLSERQAHADRRVVLWSRRDMDWPADVLKLVDERGLN